MLTVETVKVNGGNTGKNFKINKEELFSRVNPPIASKNKKPLKELEYIRLMPLHVNDFTEGISFDSQVGKEEINIHIPAG